MSASASRGSSHPPANLGYADAILPSGLHHPSRCKG